MAISPTWMSGRPSPLGTFKAEPGEDILTTLGKRVPEWELHKLDLGLGEYFPRMARPGSIRPDLSPGSNPDESTSALCTRTISTGQLHALIQELQAICRVVHPAKANFKVYGHEIRNLLIIAATEVEAQWKGVLQANHAKAETRSDYVKLSPAMKLEDYEVAIPWFPWLEPIKPFEGWMPTKKGAKQRFPWYDAYNAVKHDRENAFDQGTLEDTFHALAACFVMLCAQYGWQFVRRPGQIGDAFFQLIKAPIWAPKEIYLLGSPAKEVNYPFSEGGLL
jgi:hypothetical protein